MKSYRERLLYKGSEFLSNRELLAILIKTGTKDKSALTIADQLIAQFGSLRGLACANYEEWL